MKRKLQNIASLCPICLQRIEGSLWQREKDVFLEKRCSKHGDFSTIIWRGSPLFEKWIRPKTPYKGGWRETEANEGCPFDCGLCAAHNQRTCTALVEITSRCNLGCPVCFAESGKGKDMELQKIRVILQNIQRQTGGCNLQLSGGEPSLHPKLPEIITLAQEAGFNFIQLNSNGLRLAEEPELCHILKKAGLSSVFLQFDGLNDKTHTILRGRPLQKIKAEAIANLSAAGIGIVLVPVLVPGVNTDQLWEIIRFGLDHQPHVRGVHFQPISYFGRFPTEFAPRYLTLPEIMTGLEKQSNGLLQVEHFLPPGCEHALCSFSARYLMKEDGTLQKLGAGGCDCSPQPALQGAIKSIGVTARQWSAPQPESTPPTDELDRFLYRAKSHAFSISAMAFQDAWTINLERLQGCCIHVATPDGRLIPFCSYNLTAANGRPLHRRMR